MQEHILKTDPQPFSNTVEGRKRFEIRKDDRGFNVGDVLTLRETKYSASEMQAGYPLEYTRRFALCIVTHLLRAPDYGIPAGYVVMSIRVDSVGEMPCL